MTLPGEGKDRVFTIQVKWLAQVSLYALEAILQGYVLLVNRQSCDIVAFWNGMPA